MFVAVKME